MIQTTSALKTAFIGVTAIALTSGCAMFRAETKDVSVEAIPHLKADYDAADMRNITQGVVTDILASSFLANQPTPPVMTIAGVENRTKGYVDTKNLSDRIRTLLLQSGKVQFVNESRRQELLKEQGYQAAHATLETQINIGRQIGAKYMITGSLTEMSETSARQARVSKTELNYYKLTIEVTDLETGLIIWTTEKEFSRSLRTPLIGW